jgi:hypothetical protein
VRRLVLILVTGLLVSACGEAPRAATDARVELKLSLPDDGGMVRDERVLVRGTVTPADAAVSVGGEDADVSAGEFTAEVPLNPGGNVIDVTATSPGRRPATDAVRITRDIRVEVPRLVGQEVDQAKTALGKLGLKATEEQGGSWLDRVLGSTLRVCEMQPAAGSFVNPQSTIKLTTAPDC